MTAHNLPIQLTSFVGRTHELAEILDLISNPDCRLLTLVGPGGMGKTRLALETGAQLIDHVYSDGIYFVALQPLCAPEFIPTAIATAIGIQFYSGAEQRDQLADYFRAKSVLLILDNFEHLLDGADFVSALLANAPNLKILVTSRETLNLQEEWRYQVQGMRFPDHDVNDDLENYSAVRLFIQCARRARPDFSPESDRHAVMRICQLVEGMPLALEITAAWLKRLPIREIVTQIEHGLDILEMPVRNVPARHRSIRAVFEHSWALLTEQERDVFKKLSVFRGGFRQETAKAVAGATLSILSALVDKSLLQVDETGRYDLHELLRQYAEEQLNVSPEIAMRTHEVHCKTYMEFLTVRHDAITIHGSPGANAEITTEIKNIRVALDWLLDYEAWTRQYDSAFLTIGLYYQLQCFFQEGEALFAKGAANLGRTAEGSRRSEAHVMQGWFITLGSQDYDKATVFFEEGLAGAIEEQDYGTMAFCQMRLSEIMVQSGNYAQAREYGFQGNDSALKSDSHWQMTFPMAHLGYVAFLMGDFEEAKRLLQESIVSAQKYDVPIGISDAQNYLGEVYLALCSYPEARQLFVENTTFSKQFAYPKGTVLALIGSGEAACALHDYSAARHAFSEALNMAMASHQIPYVLQALTGIAAFLEQTGDSGGAQRLLTFVVDHRASSHDTRTHAEQMLNRLQSETPSSDVGHPRVDSLENIVQHLLDHQLADSPELPALRTIATGLLSERELEILGLIAEGLSNKEIAEKLFLAVSTVKWYLSEIYSKIHVASRTQAVIRGRELHLLS